VERRGRRPREGGEDGSRRRKRRRGERERRRRGSVSELSNPLTSDLASFSLAGIIPLKSRRGRVERRGRRARKGGEGRRRRKGRRGKRKRRRSEEGESALNGPRVCWAQGVSLG